MKKVFYIAGICLLAFACSENKNKEQESSGSGVIETHQVHGSIVQASFKGVGQLRKL